ncbi:uncharacterized protein PAN0_017d5576 [Moesziomyces antarcticus]|uniref:Uncharacterized protein n=1 Tax=Pseudozyma antarctica TaxID=84753 RepID=A0A081CL03_PSEA2|nr:uncharacterized protein PAN0_017d5576 [Moesziomyces antarcticus]GAK67349.1 hypothetical protein PAN0_017d5576 [Moesziomyces antarcticus]
MQHPLQPHFALTKAWVQRTGGGALESVAAKKSILEFSNFLALTKGPSRTGPVSILVRRSFFEFRVDFPLAGADGPSQTGYGHGVALGIASLIALGTAARTLLW